MIAALPDNEAERLEALYGLELLDTPSDLKFDTVVQLAAFALNTPIAAFSLVDKDRQWFKAQKGLEVCETPREQAFCAHAILQDVPLVVNNALEDPRFSDNPLVLGDPNIRAYLGAQVWLENGIKIGTICVIDTVPRAFTEADVTAISRFATLISSRLDLMLADRLAAETRAKLEIVNQFAIRAEIAFENMSDGLVIQDKVGKIIQANSSACRVLGLTMDQLLGRASIDPDWRAVTEAGEPFPGEDHPAMVTLRTGQPVDECVFGIHQPNGDLRWLRVSSRPLFETGSNAVSHAVTTFSDITALKLQEAELRKLSETAQAANRAKTAFLANMSHEIRTPLNGVVGIASALVRTQLEQRQKDMVNLICDSGRTLERLLSDILDLSKVEAGQVELENSPFILREEIEAAANLMRVRAEEKGLKFEIFYSSDLSEVYIGDAIRLRQIVSNLISNAIKFTEKGNVTITLSQIKSGGFQISVRDTGIGFDLGERERLFGRFTQFDTSITRRFGGTGLGLSITQAIVELMGGTIEIETGQMIGSNFRVSLPLPEGKVFRGLAESQLGTTLEISKDIRILLVEDNIMNQRVFQMMLEPMGLEATIVSDGAEAVDLFAINAFDVIFMDMQMPVMDGLTATRAIRQRERELSMKRTPIVMLTANATDAHRVEALDAGADLHVTKPVTMEVLSLAMATCLAQSAAQEDAA